MARRKIVKEPEVQTGLKTVTKIEKYQEAVTNSDDVVVLPESEEGADEATAVENFFARLDQEQGRMVRVERLPLFAKDGKAAVRSPREFVCNIQPFGQAEISTYEEMIQQGYGGGHYRCEARDPESSQVITSWVIHLANPPVPKGAPAAAAPATMYAYAQQQQQPMDPGKLVETWIEGHLKFQKLLSPTVQAPPTTSNNGTGANIPLDEYINLKTQMAVIDRLSSMQEKGGQVGEAAGRLLLKFAGVDESAAKESFWADVIKVGLEVGPILLNQAYNLVMAFRGAAPAAPANGGATTEQPAAGADMSRRGLSLVSGGLADSAAAGPVISVQPEATAQRTADPSASDLEAWGGIVRRIIYDVREGRPTHLALMIILEEEGNRPELVDAIGFLRKRAPDEVLTELQRTDATFGANDDEKESALRYINQLQIDFHQKYEEDAAREEE